MRIRMVSALAVTAALGAVALLPVRTHGEGQAAPAGAPVARFHHLHMNSTNPAAAADYYVKAFASSTRTTFNGLEAVKTSNNVHIVFNRVNTPPPTGPQSAIWHFGWNTVDSRALLQKFHEMKLNVVPMYGDPEGNIVEISSDSLPGFPTKARIDEMRKQGTQPSRVGGFQYLKGPDDSLIENAGNYPTEYFNHVHMYHEDPGCASQWYATHLGGSTGRGRAGAPAAPTDCKRPYIDPSWPAFVKEGMVREPSGTIGVGDMVSILIRPRHGPYVSPRGQVVDHVGFSVPDLAAALTRLRAAGVKVTEDVHQWGTFRVAMIEGPDLVAIELVEVKQ